MRSVCKLVLHLVEMGDQLVRSMDQMVRNWEPKRDYSSVDPMVLLKAILMA